MRSGNQIEVVLLQKGLNNLLAECERHASVIFSPSIHLTVRVGPQKVAQES
jgi:hypothetical protein